MFFRVLPRKKWAFSGFSGFSGLGSLISGFSGFSGFSGSGRHPDTNLILSWLFIQAMKISKKFGEEGLRGDL